ncbi:MAG: hypothetical protein JRI23_18155 [Deltaproteobacteria bacterium]|jgi:predicted RNA-binding Zn-ribbon protein involved in translation (DUF1610 family)|nr:hypothetical protein [Deltaproteobacteria bacterium]MBW2533778.1 hypothetical protein [Deltaproteobacteria bacterium]
MAKEETYNSFLCPFCDAELNPRQGPIIKTKGRLEAERFAVTTDVFLSSGLGVYGRTTATDVELRDGAKIEFSCPQCNAPFSEPGEQLAHIRMKDANGRLFQVSFNKTYGKRSTFVIDPEKREVAQEFGADAQSYREDIDKRLNFFGT